MPRSALKTLPPEMLCKIRLTRGVGSRTRLRMCIMMVVSWLAGEQANAEPDTTRRDVAIALAMVNDRASRRERQRLLEIAPLLVNFHPSVAIMNAAARRLSYATQWAAMPHKVDMWVTWVKLVREFEQSPKSMDRDDLRFLDDVSHGRIKSAAMLGSAFVGALMMALVIF